MNNQKSVISNQSKQFINNTHTHEFINMDRVLLNIGKSSLPM